MKLTSEKPPNGDGRSTLHSSATPEHYTPKPYAEAARRVYQGTIDLDVASCEAANRTIGAGLYYADNGQTRRWYGNVYCNPPGEPTGRLIRSFWRRANAHAFAGGAVIWAGFNYGGIPGLYNLDDLDGVPCPGPLQWPLVTVLSQAPCTTGGGRICWIDGATGQPGRHPGHGCYFCLLSYDFEMRARFVFEFGPFGDMSSHRPVPSRERSESAQTVLDIT